MFKIIKSKDLKCYLRLIWPSMFFYNEDKYGINLEIIKYIDFLSELHPKLNVFRIEFSDDINIQSQDNHDYIKKIYLYYEGQKKHEIFNPTKIDIDFLFIKFIKYYNKKIEKDAQNFGSRGKRNPNYHKFLFEPRYLKSSTEKDKLINEKRKRDFLSRKIKSPIFLDNLIYQNPQITSSEHINNIYKYRMPKININIFIENKKQPSNINISNKSSLNKNLPKILKNIIKNGGETNLKDAHTAISELIKNPDNTLDDQEKISKIKIYMEDKKLSFHNCEEKNIFELPNYTELQKMLNSKFSYLLEFDKERISSERENIPKNLNLLGKNESWKLNIFKTNILSENKPHYNRLKMLSSKEIINLNSNDLSLNKEIEKF